MTCDIVMALASREAQRCNPGFIGSEHVLIGLVEAGFGVGADVLKNLHVELSRVRLEAEKLPTRHPLLRRQPIKRRKP